MSDFKENLDKEIEELQDKYDSISEFINKSKIYEAMFLDEQYLLSEQRGLMNKYLTILKQRKRSIED
tara:strand:- start:549 stop:749 length:201 start_codon:yes stop_codon:yes gene_type:complete